MTPDWTGQIPKEHVERYTEFGDWIRACYGAENMLVRRENVSVRAGSSLVISLPGSARAASFDRVWLMEDLRYGQRIAGFTLELQGRDGRWDASRPWLFPCSTLGVCPGGGGGGGPQGEGDSTWQPTVHMASHFQGTSIGHKRIVKLSINASSEQAAPQTGVLALRVNVTAVLQPPAVLRSVAIFGSPLCA
eukprot:SAG31_NODE_1392_length_8533_cov_3.382974_3_plen_191_part_00